MAYPLVSVIFITYKRVALLRRTLESFRANTDYPNFQLVVADDGSPQNIQEEILRLPFDRHVMNKRNGGLGFNANRGLIECKGKYVLSLQDDWDCRGPRDYLHRAVELMEENGDVGLVRFYGVDDAEKFPLATREASVSYRLLDVPTAVALKQDVYSDTPHLKSRKMIDYCGPYREGCRMEDTELDFQARFLAQNQFQAAFIPAYMNQVFIHLGESQSFRTTTLRYRFELFTAGILKPFRGSHFHTFAKKLYLRALGMFGK